MKERFYQGMVWALAAVLIWAGGAKALAPAEMAEGIANFRLVSWPVAVGAAYYLPWLELLTGLAMLVPRWCAGAIGVAAVLFTSFAILWAVTWARGIDVTCGCFGGGGGAGPTWGFVRALALGVAAWICAFGALGRPNQLYEN